MALARDTVRSALPCLAVVLLAAAPALAQATATQTSPAAAVDAVFSRWNSASMPGCAVGVSLNGSVVLSRAYGMADLEHEAVITPETIFEAGSVSKQFTAAAILLLARDGKLSLDDPVRNYVPELHESAQPVTIRHMLHHTSGLRDWGAIAALEGWPRTSRAYTHAHVLDILSRQSALNFAPGDDWSYSNSGYNLAAILVTRVAGMSFADFTRTRIFEPLGMTRTSWRDDFTRVVKGRAVAYSETRGEFRTLMPFEDVHGNGGLLTTVGDLLRWNEHLQSPDGASRDLVDEQQRSGVLSTGRPHGYAFGFFLQEYRDHREVAHGGSTAGYRAYLTRLPEKRLSIAVLCNAASASADRLAHGVADVFLGEPAARTTLPAQVDADTLEARAGMYRDVKTGLVMTFTRTSEGLRSSSGGPLAATSGTAMATGAATLEFDPPLAGRVMRVFVQPRNGARHAYERVEPALPAPEELATFTGTYDSVDANVSLSVRVHEGTLVVTRRPDTLFKLTPLCVDTFATQLGTVIFRRDAAGAVTGLSVLMDRAWDVRFTRARPRG